MSPDDEIVSLKQQLNQLDTDYMALQAQLSEVQAQLADEKSAHQSLMSTVRTFIQAQEDLKALASAVSQSTNDLQS